MGFLDGLSSVVSGATDVASGYEGGVAKKKALDRQDVIQAIKNKRQAEIDKLNARNINSEIGAREHPKGTIFDQDGNPYERNADGTLSPAVIRPSSAPPSPTAPTSALPPNGDINLGLETSGPSKPSDQGATVAPPSPPQSASSPTQTAQQGTPKASVPPTAQPKFGPRPPLDPVAVHKQERDYDVAHPVPEKTDRELVQTQGEGGNPVWTPRSQAAGMPAKVTTRVESAQNTAATARLQAAVSEMNNAHKGMAEFEEGLRSGKYTINGVEQLGGRVANSFTHDDPISMGIQSTALAALNRTNPALARYIRRGLSFAEGESMISQRPSDFRTKMAAFLSTAASGASPEMIGDIQSRRNSILVPLNETVGASKAPGGTADNARKAPSGLPPLTKAQRVRAAKDPEYREFLSEKGYKL